MTLAAKSGAYINRLVLYPCLSFPEKTKTAADQGYGNDDRRG